MWRRIVVVSILVTIGTFLWLAFDGHARASAGTKVSPQHVMVDPATGAQRQVRVGDVIAVGQKQVNADGSTGCVMPRTRVGSYGDNTVRSTRIVLQTTDDCKLVVSELLENGR